MKYKILLSALCAASFCNASDGCVTVKGNGTYIVGDSKTSTIVPKVNVEKKFDVPQTKIKF